LSQLVNDIVASHDVKTVMEVSGLVLADMRHFERCQIRIPPSVLSTLTKPKSGGASVPKIDLSVLLPTEENVKAMDMSLARVDLMTGPGQKLDLGARLSLVNPVPLSVEIPYVSIVLGLEESDVMSVDLENLRLVKGRGGLEPVVGVRFASGDQGVVERAAKSLGKLVTDLLSGRNWEVLTRVKKVVLGVSRVQNTGAVFESLDVNVSSLMGRISGKVAVDLVGGLILPAELKGKQSNLGDILKALGVVVEDAGLETLSGARLSFGAQVGVGKLPFVLNMDLGYFETSVGFGGSEKALDVVLGSGLKIQGGAVGGARMDLRTLIGFSNSASVQSQVGGVCKALFETGAVGESESMKVSGVSLGVSKEDSIQILRYLELNLKLRDLLGGSGNGSGWDVTSLVESLGIRLPKIGVETKPQQTLGILAELGLSGTGDVLGQVGIGGVLKSVKVKLGHVGVGFGVVGFSERVGNVKLDNGLELSLGTGSTSPSQSVVGADVVFGESDTVQDAVSANFNFLFHVV
jgi:hypothetical protein